jgi:hypothetical protein
MVTEYPVKMKLILEPVQQPWVTVKVGNHQVTQQLTTQTDFEFEFVAMDQAVLTVEHHDKSDQDAVTAVVIQRIEFYGISDPRFVWAGQYYPRYPDHYPDQTPCLSGQDYLGWNGVYKLTFQVPVFTWMHQIKGLGWLYQ